MAFQKQVSWTVFKGVIDSLGVSKVELRCLEYTSEYSVQLFEKNGFTIETVVDKNPSDPTNLEDFETNYKPLCNKSKILEVITQLEGSDKRLKIAKGEATFDQDGNAEILVEIPAGSRYIAGGYSFTDIFCAGDYVSGVELVDINNLFGAGAGYVFASYLDTDAIEGNQGWYFEPHAPNNGYIEIEPIGGYGFMPQGTFLRVRAKKVQGSTASKVFINIWWGKIE
jgi:hypothetical protein